MKMCLGECVYVFYFLILEKCQFSYACLALDAWQIVFFSIELYNDNSKFTTCFDKQM